MGENDPNQPGIVLHIHTLMSQNTDSQHEKVKKSNRIQSQCMLICKIGHTLCNLVSSLCNISDFKDKINFINAWGKNLNIIYVFQKISVMHCTYLAGEYKKKSSKSKSEIIVNIASYAGLVQKSHIDVFNLETSYVLYYLLNNFLFMIVS